MNARTPNLVSKAPNMGTTIFTVMSALATEKGAVNLGQGFPDFPCDPHLLDLVNDAMREGLNQYPPMTGVAPLRIMARHVLPNVLGPVLVLATIQVATAIITEATLSFLGVGAPPTSPSLGTLIRVGNDYLFSGEWWITIFPGLMLVLISLSVNLLGDWLRDALNPRLQ